MDTNASALSSEQLPLLVDLEKQASPSGSGLSPSASTTPPSSSPVIPEPSSRPVGWTVFALTIRYSLALEDRSMQVMGQVYESYHDTVNAARRHFFATELSRYEPDRIMLSVAFDRESTSPLVGDLAAGQVRPSPVIVPEEAWSMVLADGVPRSVLIDVRLSVEEYKRHARRRPERQMNPWELLIAEGWWTVPILLAFIKMMFFP